MNPVNISDIQVARTRGQDVVLTTPTLVSRSFSRMLGADIWLKAENLQRTGSFKIRGAMNALSLVSDSDRAKGRRCGLRRQPCSGCCARCCRTRDWRDCVRARGGSDSQGRSDQGFGAEVILAGADLAKTTDHAVIHGEATGATLSIPTTTQPSSRVREPLGWSCTTKSRAQIPC